MATGHVDDSLDALGERFAGPKVIKTVAPDQLDLSLLPATTADRVRAALSATPPVREGTQVFLLSDWEPWHTGNVFLNSIRAKADGTRNVYASTLRMWTDYALEVGVAPTALNLDNLLEYRDTVRLEEECSPSTWNDQLSHLRAAANAWAGAGLAAMPPDSVWRDLRLTDTSIGWPRVVEAENYARFRNGIQGLDLTGRPHMEEPIKTAVRDVLYADFLVLHGPRRAEAAHLTLLELPPYDPDMALSPIDAGVLPAIICKWGSGRDYQVTRRWVERLKTYHATEWWPQIEQAQRAFKRRSDLLVVKDVRSRWTPGAARVVFVGGDAAGQTLATISKDKRRRLVMTGELAQQLGYEPGMGDSLQSVPSDWLVPLAVFPGTRTPMPVPEAWGTTFRDANDRVNYLVRSGDGPEPQRITPHMLRHTWAVNWLQTRMDELQDEDRDFAMLRANGDAARIRRRYANPLLSLKQRLGHKSLDTTLIYLRYLTERASQSSIEEASWIEHYLASPSSART
jgi:integrase